MFLTGAAEFRGLQKRESKNGNVYFLLKFESLDSADQMSFYSALDAKYDYNRSDLYKGHVYFLHFDYSYNSFDKRWDLRLDNILKEMTQDELNDHGWL